ncbi:MAG: membrane protein insertase YidC [Candidatus Ratteibacteria bacterium]|jgi:YidC/Oxa1 family membrane protein insertase
MEKRVLFAFILSLGVLLLFQYFQVKNQPVKPPAIPVQSTPANETQTSQPEITRASGFTEKSPVEKYVPEGKKIIIETNLYRATIDTRGGQLTSLALKHYTRKKKLPFQKEDETLLETIPQGAYYPFKISEEDDLTFSSDRENISLSKEKTSETLILQAKNKGRLITKKFTFDNQKYGINFELSITGGETADNITLVGFSQAPPPTARSQTVEQVIVYSGDKPARFKPGSIKNGENKIADAAYLALNDGQYILTFLKPDKSLPALLSGNASGSITAAYALTPETAKNQRFYFYSGPTDNAIIAKEGVGIAQILPSGPMVLLGRFILKILTFFHRIIPNWGVAIILLTILLKIIFFPLTRLSLRTMKTMQKLQPYLKDLSKKYKNNPKAMQQEMFGIYKQYHINPMAGCLPMLVQIPIFISIFLMLKTAIVLRGAPFCLWISDLSLPDALFTLHLSGRDMAINILPFLMGLTTFFQQKLSAAGTTGVGAQQQKMMTFMMPVMLTIFLYNLPSGLMLYWTVTNLFSILEQELSTHNLATI